MSAAVPHLSRMGLVVERVAHRSEVLRMETAQVRGDWQEFGWGDVDEPGPQTETAVERGFRLRGPVDDQMGRSESIDPDNVGDIADETPGHRG